MATRPTPLISHAKSIWRAGVAAADPFPLMQLALHRDGDDLVLGRRRLQLSQVRSITVVGAGKAGTGMSQAVEAILGGRLLREKQVQGWVNVPADTVRRLRAIHLHPARRSHENRSTRAGVAGTRRILSMLARLGRGDLALCLLSGGGSALMPAPATGITLGDKREVTAVLQSAGATIIEVNTVRRHLSDAKGGGLTRSWRGQWLTSFVLSDVVGDPLDVIASGPTAVDPTTFHDAIEILRRFAVWDATPPSVRSYLQAGAAGLHRETLKQQPPGVEHVLIGSNRSALEGASRKASRLGYRVLDASHLLRGEAAEAGRRLAAEARAVLDRPGQGDQPICFLGGGETTVRLGTRPGKGGRCQELVLAALVQNLGDDWSRIAFLCAGTDGEDGPTDAAGAFVDRGVIRRARTLGLDAGKALARHDAYSLFDRVGGLFRPGWTGTNVMDLAVVLVR
jgi:hydroxypyruvate reductase/glycerate 2-kinase